jgi:hypothetical protein
MKKLCGTWILIIAAVCLLTFSANAFWAPEWEVTFLDSLDTGENVYFDVFSAGVGGNGSDGYGMAEDLLKVYPPGWPDSGYSGIQSPYLGMSSSVGGNELSKDARASLAGTLTWNIDKKAFGTLTGTETINWDVSGVPDTVSLTLYDHGSDGSRSSVVAQVDMKSNPSYVFSASGSDNTYCYMSFVASVGGAPVGPVVTATIDGSGFVTLHWDGSSSNNYAIYSTDDLTGSWTAEDDIPGFDGAMQWTDFGSSAAVRRFYKIEVYTP